VAARHVFILKKFIQIVMWTETEKLMIHEWLHILQRDYRVFNIDTRHQCLANNNRSTIVRILPGVSHFYGCFICGQFHLCRLTERCGCVIHTDAVSQRLTCLYSGLLMKESVAYDDKTVNQSNETTIASSVKSYATFGEKKLLYTNIQAPKIEEIEESEHSEQYHSDSKSESDVEEEEEQEQEEEELMKIDQVETKRQFNNRAYWDEYYKYLHTIKTITTTTTTTTINKKSGIKIEEDNVADRIRLLIDNLLRHHSRKLEASIFESLKSELIAYYTPLIYRILLLVCEQLQYSKLNDMCDAILLELLRDTYSREDQCGYRIEVWYRDAWLKELYDSGVMSQLFVEKKRRKKNDPTKIKPLNLNKNNIKTLAGGILQCLTDYHAHWLRRFINTW
jgi:hypothetical protein